MLRKLKNKIKVWAVNEIFKLYFKNFLYPFEKADEAFKKLRADQKAKYLRDVNNWLESEAYRLETQEILRKYYQELALKPFDDIGASGYRLAILMEHDRQKRLRLKQKEYNEIVSLD